LLRCLLEIRNSIDESINLPINAIQGLCEGLWVGRWLGTGDSDKCWPEHSGIESGEKPTYLPPIRSEKITVRVSYSANDSLARKASQVISHHRRLVVPIKEVCHLFAEIGIAEPIEQVKKQGEGCKQGHDSRISQFEPWSRLTIVCDGRGDYPLNALTRQAAVMADPLDIEKTSVDVATYEGKIGKI